MSDVFISYSRKDIAFARLIQKSLQQSDIDTWIDWERIPVGERWWEEICGAIENANVFMFIISKSSIGSSVCKDEINHALINHKRIIPILVDNLKPEEIKSFAADLPQFNWIIFQRNRIFRIEKNPETVTDKPEEAVVALPKLPQFEEALQKLSQAIHTDWEWVKYHTRFQLDALRWDSNGRNPSYLAQGLALEEAERLLLGATSKDPRPTSLQVEYVTASRQEETRRQHETLRLEQKARQRQRFVIWAVGLGLTVAIVLGVVAWNQRNQYLDETHVRATAEFNAINQRSTAQAASTLAVEQRNEAERQAQIALSGQLSAQSQNQLGHQLDLAMLLSAESFLTADTYHSRSGLLLALEQSPRLERIYRYPEDILALAFTPDGREIAAAGCAERDGSHEACLRNEITFYDVASGKANRVLPLGEGRPTGMAFTPDGAALYVAVAGDRVYRYTSLSSDSPALTPLPAFDHSSGTVVISPDGKYMASGGCDYYSTPGGLCTWGGLVLWDLSDPNPTGLALDGKGTQMHNLAFSPTGDLLYAGDCAGLRTVMYGKTSQDYCNSGKVKIWDLATSTMQEHVIEGSAGAIVSVDVSADGKFLAAGEADGAIHILDLENWKQTTSYEHNLSVDSLLFSSAGNGHLLASLGFGDPIEIHDASNSGKEPSILEPYQSTRFSHAMAVSADGRYLASSTCATPGMSMVDCSQGLIFVWDFVSWQPVTQVFNSPNPMGWNNWQVGFDPARGGKATVIASSEKGIVEWDVGKNQPAGKPFISGEGIDWAFIFLSHSGNILAYPDLIQGEVGATTQMHFWDVATHEAIGEPVEMAGSILDAKFSPDDRWMVSTGPDNMLLVWDTSTAKIVRKIKIEVKPGFIELAFSPDGKTLAVAGCIEGLLSCKAYQVSTFNLLTGNPTGTPFKGETNGNVKRLVFNPTGDKIGLDYYVSTNLQHAWWDIESGQLDQTMDKIPAGVFSPDGRYMFSSDCISGNGSSCGIALLTLWDVQKWEPVGQPIRNPDQGLTVLGFSPDGKSLYTFGVGKLTTWSVDPQDWLERVCRISNRNLDQREWALYMGQAPYHKTCPMVP